MKKIFIIGSEGFIGTHTVSFFLKKGWAVYGIDLKDYSLQKYNYYKVLPSLADYDEYVKSILPDVCLFASGSANVSHSMQYPLSDIRANSLQVFQILDSIRQNSPACKFINLSSAAVYGNPKSLPVSEKAEISPMSPYGWHKYYSELMGKEFFQVYGIRNCSLRPFSVYGPLQTKLLLWDLFVKMKSSSEQVELFGTGEESRDFIFITDVIESLYAIIENAPMNGEVYNIASGSETTIKSVVEIFLSNFDYKGKIKFNQQVKKGDPLNWRADISKISEFGFSPSVNINEGIKLYCDWLKQHHL
jgi:UDP-glucose 4-epimerase